MLVFQQTISKRKIESKTHFERIHYVYVLYYIYKNHVNCADVSDLVVVLRAYSCACCCCCSNVTAIVVVVAAAVDEIVAPRCPPLFDL